MSTLSNKELLGLVTGISKKAVEAKKIATTPGRAIEVLADAINEFADGIANAIKNTPEWELQEKLKKCQQRFGEALLEDSSSKIDFEVEKSKNYQEAYPKFDVTIIVPRDEMAPRLGKDLNAKSKIENEFSRKMETLGIERKSMIGKVTVEVTDP